MTDSGRVGEQPRYMRYPAGAYAMLAFILLSGFAVLNIFVGVLVSRSASIQCARVALNHNVANCADPAGVYFMDEPSSAGAALRRGTSLSASWFPGLLRFP